MLKTTICWKCKHFEAKKDGKKMAMGCSEAGRTRWTKRNGFVAIDCPKYTEEY